MRHRTVVASFPDATTSPEPMVRLIEGRVSLCAAGPTVYDAVDLFEREMLGALPEVLRAVETRIPLRSILNLHNVDGIRDSSQIAGMTKKVLGGGDVVVPTGLPNAKIVVTEKGEVVLFDGHHSAIAYMAAGRKYLHETSYVLVHNGKGRVSEEDVFVFWGSHSKKLTLSNWRECVIDWQVPPDRQLCERRERNMGELFDALPAEILGI